jgi:hypothetical protein
LYQRFSRALSLPGREAAAIVRAVDEKDWRATYTQLLRQIRDMQRQLARAQEEARVVRQKTAMEREKLKSVQFERRTTARFKKITEPEEFIKRRKKR